MSLVPDGGAVLPVFAILETIAAALSALEQTTTSGLVLRSLGGSA